MDQPWPYNSVWLEREEPLAQCPSAACRRAGSCERMAAEWKHRLPCRLTHEHQDELYDRVAEKISKFTAELKRNRKPGDPDPTVEPGSPEFEERFAFLYNLIHEKALQYDAEITATKAAKRRSRPRARVRRDPSGEEEGRPSGR